ncbi:serine hydrolase [Flavobacterium granuli]|uniref:serine hydrolase n=1 Tax=Flavobacterium granuli TaxID=280093 RepID=UPI00286C6B41|nr:serine hydrolase [Flavobacterium granuli]
MKKDVTAPFNTIFNVASLTKPIVSMLTLKLVSSRKLKLDEPLYKYFVNSYL